MSHRRREIKFRPMLDTLPTRIAPTVYTPVDLVPMGSGNTVMVESTSSVMSQTMPSDTDDMVGPDY